MHQEFERSTLILSWGHERSLSMIGCGLAQEHDWSQGIRRRSLLDEELVEQLSIHAREVRIQRIQEVIEIFHPC
jgi:hypothetical protein